MSYRYLLFNKPYDVLSQFTDSEGGRATLKDFIEVPGVYPIGRLDRDSEGLMLLSDHGQLQHRLAHPKFRHPRTYWVQVERVPDEASLVRLRQGVALRDYRTLPAQVKVLSLAPELPPRNPPIRFRKTVPTAWLEMTLQEGKNRQVRRMTAAVGFPTLRLVRVEIAHLRLGTLAPGTWRTVTPQEQKKLMEMLSGPREPDNRRSKGRFR